MHSLRQNKTLKYPLFVKLNILIDQYYVLYCEPITNDGNYSIRNVHND